MNHAKLKFEAKLHRDTFLVNTQGTRILFNLEVTSNFIRCSFSKRFLVVAKSRSS